MKKIYLILIVSVCSLFLSSTAKKDIAEPVVYIQDIPIAYVPAIYDDIVFFSTQKAGVPLWLFARLIEKESSWRPRVTKKNNNGTTDLGIAQFNSKYLTDYYWFDNYGKKFDPMKPEEALPVSARYLKRLYNATGDWWLAVAAYECGLTRVLENRIPIQTVINTDKVLGGWIDE
jgi:hypothetical protein